MNKRLISVFVFALAVSVLASVVLYRLISTKLTASAKPSSVQLVVANHDLSVGTLIKDSDVKVVDWFGPQPKGSIPKSDDVIGRGVVVNINEGEPIVDTRLAAKGAGAGLAATIPTGMRAVAVRVNDVVGVGGFVVPGMRVDLLIAGTPPGGVSASAGPLERTLLQNIQVLSAGQNIQKDAEGKPVNVPVVNLLVTPEQAEVLSLASSETRIQLVLRNPMDKDAVKTPGTTVANLFGNPVPIPPPRVVRPKPRTAMVAVEKPAPPAPPAPEPVKVTPPLIIEVISGGHRTEMKVPPPSNGDGSAMPFEVAPPPSAKQAPSPGENY